jgi:hypothetical protein
MPTLSYLVNWKETFFLNMIIQLPCTLTVSVCKRSSNNNNNTSDISSRRAASSSIPNNNTSQFEDNSPSTEDQGTELVERKSTSIPKGPTPSDPQYPDKTTTNPSASSTSSTSSSNTNNRSKMIALRRITKKVYAAPYKSRMDIKDAFMNECSYPLVYYTVNDYESHDLHLHIQEKEYLCVELSAAMPDESLSSSTNAHKPASASDAIASLSVDQDPSPFPVPQGYTKIVLFQGAVPYASLLDVFMQKGSAHGGGSGRSSGSGWGSRMSGSPNTTREGALNLSVAERTEYIMMRGPNGKGQCQGIVIIHNLFFLSLCVTNENFSGHPRKPTGIEYGRRRV